MQHQQPVPAEGASAMGRRWLWLAVGCWLGLRCLGKLDMTRGRGCRWPRTITLFLSCDSIALSSRAESRDLMQYQQPMPAEGVSVVGRRRLWLAVGCWLGLRCLGKLDMTRGRGCRWPRTRTLFPSCDSVALSSRAKACPERSRMGRGISCSTNSPCR